MTRIACLLVMSEPAGNEPAGDEPARPALLRVALAHSPRVEDAGAGRIYLDASGLEGLFGDEPRLKHHMPAEDRDGVLPCYGRTAVATCPSPSGAAGSLALDVAPTAIASA